jgi:hypothetical protein
MWFFSNKQVGVGLLKYSQMFLGESMLATLYIITIAKIKKPQLYQEEHFKI